MKINDIGYCIDDATTLYQVTGFMPGDIIIVTDIKKKKGFRYILRDQFWVLLNFDI